MENQEISCKEKVKHLFIAYAIGIGIATGLMIGLVTFISSRIFG